ncbi:MAG: hypothetical protein HFF32_07905 [Flavonifractor sp.]|nr:hypothetical protein [Flavonifractor sp.]
MKENRQGFLSRRNHKISKLVKQVLKFSSAWRKSPSGLFRQAEYTAFLSAWQILLLAEEILIRQDTFFFPRSVIK